MPKKVYNNVIDHRLYIDGQMVEDITSVALPTISHPTTSFDVSGMTGAVDVPNQYKVEAMQLTVNHNGGVNSNLLATPGSHFIEFRIARQVFNSVDVNVGVESTKYRFTVLHNSTTDGTAEAGNPLGTSDVYSVLSFEKVENGVQVLKVSVNGGDFMHMGISYSDPIKNLLE